MQRDTPREWRPLLRSFAFFHRLPRTLCAVTGPRGHVTDVSQAGMSPNKLLIYGAARFTVEPGTLLLLLLRSEREGSPQLWINAHGELEGSGARSRP